MITKGVAARAIGRDDIFIRAAQHRQIYFSRSRMDYSTLRHGSLRVVPLPEQEAEWRHDYQARTSSKSRGYQENPKKSRFSVRH